MIRHIHVNECDSTQDLLKEQLNNKTDSDSILVSCNTQNQGRGRSNNTWISMPGTLCFSLLINPHQVISFTALEISVLVAKYFELKDITLKLKWPNDIWNYEQKKCGGILVQGSMNSYLAGIGINIFSHQTELGGIYDHAFELDKKKWAYDISNFIQTNRFNDTEELKQEWQKRCGHQKKLITITEADHTTKGIFEGLGDHGEALINQENVIKKIYNGSLNVGTSHQE